jgi:hypothetical protein
MAGTFTAKSLADGQVPNTKGTIYTVGGSTVGYVKLINLFNTNAAQQTINLYVKRNGSVSRQLRQFVLAQYESGYYDLPMTLSDGDIIEADSTNASAVDYLITGAEET